MAEEQSVVAALHGGGNGGYKAEIDTSAPFDSVKEAVTRFGGLGFWKPQPHILKPPSVSRCDMEELDISKVEEQAAELEKELILKERDTLEVLKELEATKKMVEELKLNLQREQSSTRVDINVDLASGKPTHVKREEEEEEKENNPHLSHQKLPQGSSSVQSSSSSSPDVILMELKQAKLNLTRTTSDLAEIRALVETYNKKIEKERVSLEKTRERLRSNSMKISSLEEEIHRTRSKLEETEGTDGNDSDDGTNIMAELQRLTAEAEQFKKIGETAKGDAMRVMLDIEQTKTKVKTAEIRLVAARKMKEAATAAEAVALGEIKALEKSKIASEDLEQNPDNITLTPKEYTALRCKAQDAERSCSVKVLEAMLQVDEANVSKSEMMKRVEETMEEVNISKQVLEEALDRVEAANQAKLAVEEALRNWRSEHGERRRSIQNSIKFKNPYPSNRKRDSLMLDVNGITLASNAKTPGLKPSLSIGQILSNKLLVAEEFESRKGSVKRKVSLGQMLGKQNADMSAAWKLAKDGGSSAKKFSAKRKKFGFARFSVLLNKQSKKKKSTSCATR